MLSLWISINEIKPSVTITKNKSLDDAMFWCQKGYQMSREGHIDNSIDYYTQGWKQDPDNYIISYNLGCVYASIK